MTGSAVRIADDTWRAALDAIDAARDVLLVCHVAPDGDALGSMLGLARVLRTLGKRTTCTWGDEHWVVPRAYRWLPGIDDVVPPSKVDADHDLMVVLDTGSRDRLGVLAPLADAVPALVVVDHHAHNQGLDGTELIDHAAAATAVIVEELLRRLGAPVDEQTAACLYTGLVTDTGSFAHSVTTPPVHQVAARLLAAGARPEQIAARVWGTRPFGYVAVLGAALSRARLDRDAVGGRGLVWTWTTVEDLDRHGIGLDDVEGVIDSVRVAEEADVAVVCKQDCDRSFRVSMRSRGATDVGAVAVDLGGGGHRLAAGFTSYDDVDATMTRLRAALETAPGLPQS